MTSSAKGAALVGLSRRLFRTAGGQLGLGPSSLRPGDKVWLIKGAISPFVLREAGEGKHILVGEAYMLGFMHGEMLEGKSREQFESLALA